MDVQGRRRGYVWMLSRIYMEIILIVFRYFRMIKYYKLEHESPQQHTGKNEPVHVQNREIICLDAVKKR